ncbi:MAG: YukJ family protein [Vallitalea sp.]|jgi:uncharacterized protein YukJ|nr:YukJ family protein [Vallitalea sp.]
MSSHSYGLLKCKAVGAQEERDNNRPHYHIHVKVNDEDYRVSVNIKSNESPSELLFYTNDNFKDKVTSIITKLPYGFYYNQSIAIDYVRGDMGFGIKDMKKIPHNKLGPNNDLNEKLSHYINMAMNSDKTDLYVYGTRWRSSTHCKPDRIFDFTPSMGMHDIHMNQGNIKHWQKDNGVWQDGCILIHFTETNKWVGIFLAFQSQSWITDDCTGNKKDYHKKNKINKYRYK